MGAYIHYSIGSIIWSAGIQIPTVSWLPIGSQKSYSENLNNGTIWMLDVNMVGNQILHLGRLP